MEIMAAPTWVFRTDQPPPPGTCQKRTGKVSVGLLPSGGCCGHCPGIRKLKEGDCVQLDTCWVDPHLS